MDVMISTDGAAVLLLFDQYVIQASQWVLSVRWALLFTAQATKLYAVCDGSKS
jgi:hypothetical protein